MVWSASSVGKRAVARPTFYFWSTGALLLAGLFLFGPLASAEPIPVELRKSDAGWQLLRGGEPYFIRGAGGGASLKALAEAGGNSVRTWGGDPGPVLDEAHALGMTVTVGLWLGHERHGFDYGDPEQVARQLAEARDMVERYKDHPALLLWGVGNETEGFDQADDPKVWAAINDVAAMIRKLDPNHPTMAVTAYVHGQRIDYLHRRCPDIDIHGINAYGAALQVPTELRKNNASKPFVLTEFGPIGPWEMPTTDWGAPYEQTSDEKAGHYRKVYEQTVLAMPGMALGSYAFLWGHKMEGTATWFGMFLDDGAPTAIVHTMSELWSGKPPANRAPIVEPLKVTGPVELEPGSMMDVHTRVVDPDDDSLTFRWVLRPESGDYATGGDPRPQLSAIEGAIAEADLDSAQVSVPERPGAYRLFLYVYDEAGNAGTANLPIRVIGEPTLPLPFAVYSEGFEGMPWVPSGWMGNIDQLHLDGSHSEITHDGHAAIRMRYEGQYNWVGVAWQNPPNNWGDLEGGHNLNGASALELWARGEYGGEKATFGVGLLEQDREHPDSGIKKIRDITLTREWQRFEVPLKDVDLSSIKTGFVVTLTGRSSPVTVYLDSIRFIP